MSEDLQREIDQTREHLGVTVDALAAKLDVKTRAQESFQESDKRKLGLAAAMGVAAIVALVLWRRR
ncbi:DUF3618 domain-containing protein [Aeromicrobium sp.]|uniref:DUF3618 domain-containing protein n=1 Tax=Aeromicrobium sp. TaxID=1871063 RepID=UPI0030BCD181